MLPDDDARDPVADPPLPPGAPDHEPSPQDDLEVPLDDPEAPDLAVEDDPPPPSAP